MSILERSRAIWKWVRSAPSRLPARVAIGPDHILGGALPPEPFEPNEHYFQVRVNEMFLASSRQWFAKFDPMILTVTEFIYDHKVEAVPFVVGPALLEKYGYNLPSGMIFSDTRVAGLHPYRGGRVVLSVVLFRVQGVNYARKLLQLVESASGLSSAAGLGTYLKLSEVVIGGVEALLGLQTMQPVVGFRKEFDPDAGDELLPGHFALVDAPQTEISPDQLWVHESQLLVGPSADTAKPLRQADFVLYSLAQDRERSDVEVLPFYPLWQRVADEAMSASSEENDWAWKNAKSAMATLSRSLDSSPDLTRSQAESLEDMYLTRMEALKKRALRRANLGGPENLEEAVRLDRARRRAAAILEL